MSSANPTSASPSSAFVPSDATFRRFFDMLSNGVALIDSDQLTVRYANATLLHLLDRELDDVLGRSLVALVGSADVEPTLALARAPAEQHIGIELCARDGTLVPVSLSIARVETPEGPVLGVIAFDLSGQHELMRMQSGRLHQLGRGKQEFIAMLGHELRNPLAPLRHAAELLDRATADARGPEVSELTQLIHRQVDHMARLVSDLLDVSRATTGHLPIRPQPMRVSEIFVAALESTAHLIERRKLTVERNYDDLDGLELDADPVRLTQMLTNLLSNAAKFAPDGGRIELSCREHEGALTIRVRDNGIGLREDELSAIFEPFYQVRGTLDRAGGGLGVGLALVRSIVELHGGTVRASSDGLGHGSTFEVSLPGARRHKSPPVAAPPPPPTSRAALDVLVIDDNEDAAQMLAMLLERRGCSVDIGFLGREALAKIMARHYDVAFIDIGLPDLDGYALAERVAKVPTCPRRLVALTGYGQPEDRARALAAGFHEHVVKPLSPRRLDGLLAAAASRAPPRAP